MKLTEAAQREVLKKLADRARIIFGDGRATKGGHMKIVEGKVKTMTVGQLIDALSAFPADFEVLTEGCDCLGDVASVEETDSKLSVILRRTKPGEPPSMRTTYGPYRPRGTDTDGR